MMLVLLVAIFMFSFTSIRQKNPLIVKTARYAGSSIPDSLFQSGDLIFRDGRGFISMAFRKLSLKDPRYSHAGIIHREAGEIYVYHVLGGEGGSCNTMRKEPLVSFCSPFQSNGFGVYRTDQDADRIDSLASVFFNRKIEFDEAFDLVSDEKMYCTELVYKILTRVSGIDNFLPLTTLSGVRYESCDNIYLSPHVVKIYSQN